ncbi:MAG: murein hydrolase activator EnvC family protein [bacterium]
MKKPERPPVFYSAFIDSKLPGRAAARLSSLILIVVLLAGASPVCADEERQRQLQLLRDRIHALQAQIDADGQRHDTELAQLAAIERELGTINRAIRTLDRSLAASRERLRLLQKEELQLNRSLQAQQQELAKQLRAAYQLGRQERLKMLLNQQEPESIGRMIAYYDYFNRARAEQLDTINQQLAELQTVKISIEQEQQAQLKLKAEQQQAQQQRQQSHVERKRVIVKLADKMRGDAQKLSSLQQDEQQLQRLLKGIQEALEDIDAALPGQQSFAARKGRMSWPATGRIQASFGTPRIGELKWDGVVIGASEGDEVKAVHRGRVAYADWLRGFGLLVIIDHGEGFMSLYGHNQTLYKETGDWVEAGDLVASVGHSGGRKNAAVYFGIRRDGRPVNPKKWCKRPRGNRVSS